MRSMAGKHVARALTRRVELREQKRQLIVQHHRASVWATVDVTKLVQRVYALVTFIARYYKYSNLIVLVYTRG